MRKTICVAGLAIMAAVGASHAVVIHWATAGLPTGATSAQLVYVQSGAPLYANDALVNGVLLGDPVSGLAITPFGVGQQNTADTTTRTAGNYFVTLFKTQNAQIYYSYGLQSLAFDDTSSITRNVMAPAMGVFMPGTFSDWAPIPEPGSAALLALGVAVLALRRRHRV